MLNYTAFIGTNSTRNSEGIYTLKIPKKTLYPNIKCTQSNYNAGALALSNDNNYLYAVEEGMTYKGYASGGVNAYKINKDGSLSLLNGMPTNGQRPCSINVDKENKHLYVANFFGGSISIFSLNSDGSINQLVRTITELKPKEWLHAIHDVNLINNGKFLAYMSVASSSFIVINPLTGKKLTQYNYGNKVFVRSFTSFDKYIYTMLQKTGEIFVLEYLEESNKIRKIQKVTALEVFDKNMDFGTSAIKITPNGKLLLAGIRNTNSISIFSIGKEGQLKFENSIELPGECPRDFNISADGKIVITALQQSDEVCIHTINYENKSLDYTNNKIHIPSPAAIEIIEG
ncbi:MAG: lactonase family protein [Pleomorphochaeta sp.]